MNYKDDKKLDNPVWHSLNETHQHFALNFQNLKCYQPDCCPFGGYVGAQKISKDIDSYAKLTDNFFIVGEKPETSHRVVLKNELVCLQMVIDNKIGWKLNEEIVELNKEHSNQLFDLVNLVQPGYFKIKTMEMGAYYGIFEDKNLVAVTGERMKMYGFTEVSAVVTHPHYTGRGYAKQLITHTVNNIMHNGGIPYLHVAESNLGAINLYQRLGFKIRRRVSFWNFVNQSLLNSVCFLHSN